MAERYNRDPAYDLARHIITGETGPLSGSDMLRKFDAEADRNDPMEDFTNILGVAHMQSGNSGALDQEPAKEAVDLNVASNCFDETTKGGLTYGPKNTGGIY